MTYVKNNLEIIKTRLVAKLQDDWIENVASRVFISSSGELIKGVTSKQNKVVLVLGCFTTPINY